MHAMRHAGGLGFGSAPLRAEAVAVTSPARSMPEPGSAVQLQRIAIPYRPACAQSITTASRASASTEACHARSILQATTPSRPCRYASPAPSSGHTCGYTVKAKVLYGALLLCGGGAPENRAFFNCYNLIFTIRAALARAEIGNPKRKRMAAGFRRAASASAIPCPVRIAASAEDQSSPSCRLRWPPGPFGPAT